MAKLNSVVRALAVLAVFVSIGVLASGCSLFPPDVKRPVVNHTGSTITHVYIKIAGSGEWGSERNKEARTREVTHRTEGGGSYTTTEYVLNFDGSYIYDRYDIPAGGTYPYHFSAPKVPDGQTPQYHSVDVRVVDSYGVVYGKNNVDLSRVEQIIITAEDMYPVLVLQNNTGYRVQVTAPTEGIIENGGSAAVYQIKVLGVAENIKIKLIDENGLIYGKNDMSLVQSERVVITPDDMYPSLSVQNNTGFPVNITAPKSGFISDGSSAVVYQNQEFGRSERVVVSYNSGTFGYKKEATLADQHMVITLTETDRPPKVTIQNNTEKTINLVNLRSSGPSGRWDGHNILTLNLKEDGTLETIDVGSQATERMGSLTNKDAFQFWLGNLKVNPGNYDIRLDNTQGDSYVKNNLQIIRDTTFTFTSKDKP